MQRVEGPTQSINPSELGVTTPELFVPVESDESDWREAYEAARKIMGYSWGTRFTFDESKALIASRVPTGRIGAFADSFHTGLRGTINIHPNLAQAKTSPNFKEIILAHMIGERQAVNDPITYFSGLKDSLLRREPIRRRRHANRLVYENLLQIYGPEIAKKRMLEYAETYTGFLSVEGEAAAVEEYVKKYMPFLLKT